MSHEYTSDETICAAAENFCIAERRAGREPVFSPLVVGHHTTWRQRRLFEFAMIACETRERPEHVTVHLSAVVAIGRLKTQRCNFFTCSVHPS